MANGDAAAAAGMDVVPSTAQVKMGYDEINKTRDYIVTKGIPATGLPIAQGGTGATTLAAARSNLGISAAGIGAAIDGTGNGLKFTSPSFGALSFEIPGLAFPTTLADAATMAGKVNRTGDTFSGNVGLSGTANLTLSGGHVYVPGAIPATSGYTNAYINGDGRLARGTSSRRYKTDIKSVALPELGDVLALQPVRFKWRHALGLGLPTDHREIGLIAEDMAEAVPWLATYTDDGQPEAVRYEMVGLALLPIVRDLVAQVAELRAQLAGA